MSDRLRTRLRGTSPTLGASRFAELPAPISAVRPQIRKVQYAFNGNATTSLTADAGSISVTSGNATLSVNVGSEAATAWFNGQWWPNPYWGTSWWGSTDTFVYGADAGSITITGGEATLSYTATTVLDGDAISIDITSGEATFTTTIDSISGDAGVILIRPKEATFQIEYTATEFTLSTSGTFDGKNIDFTKDVALHVVDGIGYKIVQRIDVDTILLNGIFGDPPQQFLIEQNLCETDVPARMEFEFNGTHWVLVSKTLIGL
jgi:hypothetical protein